MKMKNWKSMLVVMTAGLTMAASKTLAQDSMATMPAMAAKATVPPMSYATQLVLQMKAGGDSDATIMAYIKSYANSYGLTSSQLGYLRDQGVSSEVIAAMLQQGGALIITPAQLPRPMASTPLSLTVAPVMDLTYEVVPPSRNFFRPAYCPLYYPAAGAYPPVSMSFSWGWHQGDWHGGVNPGRVGHR